MAGCTSFWFLNINNLDTLQQIGSDVSETYGQHDVLTQALGTEEQRGRVRGMGKFVTPSRYFFLPKTVKQYMDTEKTKVDQRFGILEDEVDKLKKGMNNASEAGSCQVWGNEDFEDEPPIEPCDKPCYLAVDDPLNMAAKGTILMEVGENSQVIMECSLQGELPLPFPLEEELISKVKHGVGHILSWPRHLVIRLSDLGKVVKKPVPKPLPEIQSKKTEKRLREPNDEKDKKNRKEKEKGKAVETREEKNEKPKPYKENDKPRAQRKIPKRRTRAQRKAKVRIEKSAILRMAALMADGQLEKVDSIKVQSEDDCFGYESFTYLSMEDFEAVFTLDWLSGSVITSYMMYLYERIKNGPIQDHGICFVTSSATMTDERKTKSKHIDDSSKLLANRLCKRNNNDIIIVPYNPGKHWVLAVLDMKTTTCYYLDSLRPIDVCPELKQIIDSAMVLNAIKMGSDMRVKVNWINSKCPT